MRALLIALLICLAAPPCRADLAVHDAVGALHKEAQDRIAAGEFDALLADADSDLQTQARLPDGRWKLAFLLGGMRRGFSAVADTPQQWDRYAIALKALAARHPASPNAWLFLAVLEDSHAWAERGNGYSDTVSDASKLTFKQHLALSRDWLDAHKVPANPAWYELRISVGGALGESAEDLDRLFFAATRREPGYQQTWFARLMYLEPKWGGDYLDMLGFINHAGHVSSTAEGHGMMARLIWIAAESGYDRLVSSPPLDWNALKLSYDDVLKRYPDDWNAQWFFFDACKHGDKAEAQHLLTFVKEAPSPSLLHGNVAAFQACENWARGQGGPFEIVDPQTKSKWKVK